MESVALPMSRSRTERRPFCGMLIRGKDKVRPAVVNRGIPDFLLIAVDLSKYAYGRSASCVRVAIRTK
jgi:hypothetical protein